MSIYPPPSEPALLPEYREPGQRERSFLSLGFNDGQTLHHFLLIGKKYLWLVLVCAMLGVGAGFIQNATTPKEYRSTANIEITQDTADQFRMDTGGGYDGGYIDVTKLDTEIAILKSSTLALKTIQSLHLDKNKDFLPLGSNHVWDLSKIGDRHALIGMFEGGLAAERFGHTNILDLSFTARNPELAALICNTLISNYVEHNFTQNYAATREVSDWLGLQLGDLKKRLEASQEHMLTVQKDIGLVGIDQTQSIVLSRLVDISHDLTQAETQRLVSQARLVTLESAPSDVLATLSGDSVLLGLKERLTSLQAELASLSPKYGAKNPRLLEVRSEIAEVSESIKREQEVVIARAQEEVKAATENQDALQRRLDQEKGSAYMGNSKAVEYTLARREYEANRSLYDGLQQRLQEAGILAGLHSTNIRRIDPADPPDFPSSPRKSVNLTLGLLCGLGIGLVLSFLVEALDTNIKTIYDIEERLGLPMLGVVPQVESKLLSPETFVRDATSPVPGAWSRLAEAYRALRTTILLSRAGTPPQVILISSAKPSEGKTSVTTLESIVFALNGARVLLIDSDLRRPSVHLRFRIPNKTGLTSVLTGKVPLQEAIVTVPSVPTLHILPAGPIAPMPAELLGSLQMQRLVEGLRANYDFILIDTPPVLTVTDAAVLVSISDGVVLVLRYGQASRNVVARASEILLRSGAHLLGVVLNAVDLQSSDYAEYYGRAYNDYYQSRVDVED
ncbi:MAG TPA: polysaccharide biosynthesis tyrosine autokinase [Acidobacteriaceae bacterium]|nr:polysaccharide biosynthesis tyrosine autokinase [Acidobacteriaceae bacterium]